MSAPGAPAAPAVPIRCELVADFSALRIEALTQLEAAYSDASLDQMLANLQQALVLEKDVKVVLDRMLPQLLLAFGASAFYLRTDDMLYAGKEGEVGQVGRLPATDRGAPGVPDVPGVPDEIGVLDELAGRFEAVRLSARTVSGAVSSASASNLLRDDLLVARAGARRDRAHRGRLGRDGVTVSGTRRHPQPQASATQVEEAVEGLDFATAAAILRDFSGTGGRLATELGNRLPV